MAKKKSKKDIEDKTFEIKAEAVVMLRPKEWAKQLGLNPLLFEAWKDSPPMRKEDFELIKEQVM